MSPENPLLRVSLSISFQPFWASLNPAPSMNPSLAIRILGVPRPPLNRILHSPLKLSPVSLLSLPVHSPHLPRGGGES